MTKRLLSLALLFSCSLLGGCNVHLFGAEIRAAKTVAEPPSDVTIYVTVKDSGEPIGYLNSGNFQIFENGVLLDEKKVGLRLLSRNQVASGHTILLLDLSDSPNKKELQRISRGAAHFVEKVSTTQDVTVIAFDGSERAREVARFAQVEESTKRPLPSLEAFLSKDTSRDLNSAYLAAIAGLTKKFHADENEIHYGNIVSLVRGPDLAGRKSDGDVRDAIKDTGFEYFTLIPKGLDFGILKYAGRDRTFTYDTIDTLPMRFQDMGIRVRAAWQSHYLLFYCSPARAGERDLRIEVTFQNENGKNRETSTKTEFNSDGFQSGCGTNDEEGEEPVRVDAIAAPKPEQSAEAGVQSIDPKKSEAPPPKAAKAQQNKAPPATKSEEVLPENEEPSTSKEAVVPPPSGSKYE